MNISFNNMVSMNVPLSLVFTEEKSRALERVTKDGWELKNLSPAMQDDDDVVMAAVTNCGALQYASERFRNNKEIVLKTVAVNPWAVQAASDELRNDADVFRVILESEPSALAYAGDNLKNNKELILKFVTKQATVLEYASQTLKEDADVVLTAITQDGEATRYMDIKFWDDKEFVLKANCKSGWPLQIAASFKKMHLIEDEEFVIKNITSYGRGLQFVSPELKKNQKVVLTAIANLPQAFKFADESLQDDKNFSLKAVAQNSKVFKCLSQTLQDDKDFILKAVSQNGLLLLNTSCEYDDFISEFYGFMSSSEILFKEIKYCQDKLLLVCPEKFDKGGKWKENAELGKWVTDQDVIAEAKKSLVKELEMLGIQGQENLINKIRDISHRLAVDVEKIRRESRLKTDVQFHWK